MNVELIVLTWSVVLGFAHIVASSMPRACSVVTGGLRVPATNKSHR